MQRRRAITLACRDRAIVAVLAFTAARVSAVAGLTWECFIDTGSAPMLRFVEKHSRVRMIPCNRRLATILRGYLETFGTVDRRGPMFPTYADGASCTPLAPRGILRVVRRRLIDAGLADAGTRLGCHSFRAGAATHLLQAGIELSAVQDLLGHRDPRVTRRYDHRARTVAQDTVERLAGGVDF